jgi:hypothetical protein
MMLGGLQLSVYAQTPLTVADLPYFCGFEDATENANWIKVSPPKPISGSDYPNHWEFGSAVSNYDSCAMYISNDGGVTASYTNQQGTTIIYREIICTGSYEPYQIDFDWMSLGTTDDSLFVAWVPKDPTEGGDMVDLSKWATNVNAKPSGLISNYKYKGMNGYAGWQHGSFEANGKDTMRLVFFWMNGQTAVNNPGGCIDNVQINRKRICAKPTFLTFTKNTVPTLSGEFSWYSAANSFDVKYRNMSDTSSVWVDIKGITTLNTKAYNIPLTKGLYTVWVRAHCGTDSSSWAVLTHQIVYTSLASCLDYVGENLKATSDTAKYLKGAHIECTYGTFGNPYNTTGVQNFGFDNIASRHTVALNMGARDARTNYQLSTVPYGEVASVRLGNWETGAQAESIIYTYTVDPNATVLLLRYAVVLDDPGNTTGHTASAMPRFKLEILNNSYPIQSSCGSADFVPDDNTRKDWKTNVWYDDKGERKDIIWKDWTTLGLNLQQLNLAGQTIQIRFTTYDCQPSKHFGYAYFTIDCAEGTVEGETCGGKEVTVTVPDGFSYAWYKSDEIRGCLPLLGATVIGTGRDFHANANDANDYVCRASYLKDPNCYFCLEAKVKPRFPKSKFTYKVTPRECKNVVTFINESRVMIEGELSDELCQNFRWSVDINGQIQTSIAENPEFVFPEEGGLFKVTLFSGLSDFECIDSLQKHVIIPPMAPEEHKDSLTLCNGQSYFWRGKNYSSTTYVSDTLTSVYGCDSIQTLDLTVVDVFEIQLDTAIICEGESYKFGDHILSEPGDYKEELQSVNGCDSIVRIHLRVAPIVNVTPQQMTSPVCADDPAFVLPYDPLPTGGEALPTNYRITFDPTNRTLFPTQSGVVGGSPYHIPVNMPAVVHPGIHRATVEFTDSLSLCQSSTVPIMFEIYYPDSIIKQKWWNVLAVKNELYNGGFTFTGFQWYKNGMPIQGETSSILYLGEGVTFDLSDQYYIKLTRDDGETMFTCPVELKQAKTPVSVMPTVVMKDGSIRIIVNKGGLANFWTVSGILVRSQTFVAASPVVEAPSIKGVYLMHVRFEDGESEIFRVIVQEP